MNVPHLRKHQRWSNKYGQTFRNTGQSTSACLKCEPTLHVHVRNELASLSGWPVLRKRLSIITNGVYCSNSMGGGRVSCGSNGGLYQYVWPFVSHLHNVLVISKIKFDFERECSLLSPSWRKNIPHLCVRIYTAFYWAECSGPLMLILFWPENPPHSPWRPWKISRKWERQEQDWKCHPICVHYRKRRRQRWPK